ncbi:Vitamin B12 transporter BtuB (plasmid) [Asticcacaulis sp. MM231]
MIGLVVVLLAWPVIALAQKPATSLDFDVPAQAAATGAAAFGRQAHVQVLISEEAARGRRLRAVQGRYEVDKALRLMLWGSDLRAVQIRPGVYSLVVAAPPKKASTALPKRREPDIASDPAPPQEVIVTGTRIRRPNLTSASPVVSLNRQELDDQGVFNLEEALNRLPQARADSTQFANASDTDGRAKVNLRNLGWQRTLVLLDGQRLLPVEAIDLNLVPKALVRRIDVLTGGASATYGSDAVAGVVNLVLDTDFEGLALTGSYGGFQHTNDASDIRAVAAAYPAITLPKTQVFDGFRSDISLAGGKSFDQGRGHISVFFGRRDQQAITWGDRDFSACRLIESNGRMDCVVNTIYSEYGRFAVTGGPMTGAVYYGAKDGGGVFTPGSESADYAYSTRQGFGFQRPDQRLSAGLFARYRWSETLEGYASWLGIDDRTRSLFYPALVRQTVDLNCDNPYMSTSQAQSLCGAYAGTRATVATDVAYQLNGLGSRPLDNRAINKDYRITLGVKGDFADVWHYDLGFVGSRVYTSLSDNNEVDLTKFARSLQVVDVAGTPTCLAKVSGLDPDCVPANIFGYHTIDPAFYDYAYSHYRWASVTQQQVYTAALSGDLTSYGLQSPWADKGVATAFGVEYRRDSLRHELDQATRDYEGWLSTVAGHYGVAEAYGELQVPLVSRRPFIYALELNGAYRVSRYDNQADVLPTSRYEIQYRPVKSLLLRATLNNATRAPNISELYASSYFSINGALSDPCAGAAPAATAAQCAYTGVTVAQYGHVTDCADACRTYGGGGNPLVRPEKAQTLTYGLVWTPKAGAMLSVDYYRIVVSDFIGYIDPVSAFNACLTTGLSYYCGFVHRDPLTGALSGKGYVGGATQNTYRLYNSGLDVQAAYTRGLGRFGRADISLIGTWQGTTSFEHSVSEIRVNCAGYFGSPYCYAPQPKWRHNARLTWQTPWRQAALSLNWRHIGATAYAGNSDDPAVNGGVARSTVFAKVPTYNYMDMSAGLRLRRDLRVHLSVNNLFDLTPPITPSTNVDGTTNNPNTWAGTYDALGRAVMLSFDLKL